MTPTYTYSQGKLNENARKKEPECWGRSGENETACPLCKSYREHLASLKSFDVTNPDEWKEGEVVPENAFELNCELLYGDIWHKVEMDNCIFQEGYGRILAHRLASKEDGGKDEFVILGLKELIDIRNKLYNDLPTGEINAFGLLQMIKWHINDIDNFCSRINEATIKTIADAKKLAEKEYPIEDARKNFLHDNMGQHSRQEAFIKGFIIASLAATQPAADGKGDDAAKEKINDLVNRYNVKGIISFQELVSLLWKGGFETGASWQATHPTKEQDAVEQDKLWWEFRTDLRKTNLSWEALQLKYTIFKNRIL